MLAVVAGACTKMSTMSLNGAQAPLVSVHRKEFCPKERLLTVLEPKVGLATTAVKGE